jgi:hypothetical protein
MLSHVEVNDAPPVVNDHDEYEEDVQTRGGTVKKSSATKSRTWLARNVRQVWDGGERRFWINRETVRSDTSRPSFRSSPWMRGVRRHDHERLPPHAPDPGQHGPEEAISSAWAGSRHCSLVDGELLAQGQVLEGELAVAAEEERKEPDEVKYEDHHESRL